jgi:fumarate reductase subunit D
MIMTGMGPVGALATKAAKLFAAFYALFCGLVFLSVVTITITPILHRILHKFHLADEDFKKSG